MEPKEKVICTTCTCHCGGKCILKIYVQGGTVTHIETDDGEEPQRRACVMGRAYRQHLYNANRLRFPMKRAGERGQGIFERISWDEALGTVSSELKRIKETYGSLAILLLDSGGDYTVMNRAGLIQRLLSAYGGYTGRWGIASFEGGTFAAFATFGTMATSNTRDDLMNSRLMLWWGSNPAVTRQETGTEWFLIKSKEAGARIVVIDPRYTDTAATLADRWIPIRPGTDTAMLIAMAYVIVIENLQDQAFLDTYTIGFKQFRDYVLGKEDGVSKTPRWAQDITGVPAATIENLARDYATIRPAALLAGLAPGRTAFGEQFHRAAHVLAAMTGNIGNHGGWPGSLSWPGRAFGGYPVKTPGYYVLPSYDNPVEYGTSRRKESFPGQGNPESSIKIHSLKIADAILEGKAGGYPSDYKMAYIAQMDYLSQYANSNKIAKALKMLEFIVVQEQYMTATARFADIILPTCTIFEKNDIAIGAGLPFYGFVKKVVEPLYESKSQLDIANELADKLCVSNFNDKTDEELLREFVKGTDIPDYDTYHKKGGYKLELSEPFVSFKANIEDFHNTPFPTPSGKIEIYSQTIADMKNPYIPPIPKYIETWENLDDPLVEKYPLQLISTHIKRRANSQFDALPWLRETVPQAIWINTSDARTRDIENGGLVRVFNDRGCLIISARVTERIMPGVVDIPEGGWYKPDKSGVDIGGCINVLTRDIPSPAGAMPSNTVLVQIEKAY